MHCRKVLDMSNLTSCFSNSAVARRFEDARRSTLVRADEAHNLSTLLHVMPLLHELKLRQDEFFEAAKTMHVQELVKEALEDRHYQLAVAVATEPDSRKESCAELAALRKELRSKTTLLEKERFELLAAHRRTHAAFKALTANRLAAAAGGDQQQPTAAEAARFMHCAAEGCASGLFSVADGACLVCKAQHCAACFELKEENHACDAQTRATARFILLSTKNCPRCRACIQRASGCPQMMCTSCNCVFDWTTGLEAVGAVHNPHFFGLSEAARARVIEDRSARGLGGASARAAAYACDEEAEFDPACVPFDDGRILEILRRVCQREPSIFPLKVRDVERAAVDLVGQYGEYRNVVHVEHYRLPELEGVLRSLGGELMPRLARLTRLAGPSFHVTPVKRIQRGHPGGYFSKSFVLPVTRAMSDASFAAHLMRLDTERSKVEEKIEIYRTYVETAKDLFRALLQVPHAERGAAAEAIFEFRAKTNEALTAASRRTQTVPTTKREREEEAVEEQLFD